MARPSHGESTSSRCYNTCRVFGLNNTLRDVNYRSLLSDTFFWSVFKSDGWVFQVWAGVLQVWHQQVDSESDKHPVAAVSPGGSAGDLRYIPTALPHVSASLISVRGLQETSWSTGPRSSQARSAGLTPYHQYNCISNWSSLLWERSNQTVKWATERL